MSISVKGNSPTGPKPGGKFDCKDSKGPRKGEPPAARGQWPEVFKFRGVLLKVMKVVNPGRERFVCQMQDGKGIPKALESFRQGSEEDLSIPLSVLNLATFRASSAKPLQAKSLPEAGVPVRRDDGLPKFVQFRGAVLTAGRVLSKGRLTQLECHLPKEWNGKIPEEHSKALGAYLQNGRLEVPLTMIDLDGYRHDYPLRTDMGAKAPAATPDDPGAKLRHVIGGLIGDHTPRLRQLADIAAIKLASAFSRDGKQFDPARLESLQLLLAQPGVKAALDECAEVAVAAQREEPLLPQAGVPGQLPDPPNLDLDSSQSLKSKESNLRFDRPETPL